MSASGGGNLGTPYPAGATPITVSVVPGGNTAANAIIPAVAGRLAYLTGFEASSGGSTAGSVVELVVQGVLAGNVAYSYNVPTVASGIAAAYNVAFNPPLPAMAVNTSILVGLPALGVGNSLVTVTAHGYYI